MAGPPRPQLGIKAGFQPCNGCKVRPGFASQDGKQRHVAHADVSSHGTNTSPAHSVTNIDHELAGNLRERIVGRHVWPRLPGEFSRRLPHRTSHTASVFGGASAHAQSPLRHATSAHFVERPLR